MRILFDNGTPAPLLRFIEGHSVTTAAEVGWERLRNGDLLREAEVNGYDLLLTTDKRIRYQQNLSGRRLRWWPRLRGLACCFHIETHRMSENGCGWKGRGLLTEGVWLACAAPPVRAWFEDSVSSDLL